jgi:hypothetical protein
MDVELKIEYLPEALPELEVLPNFEDLNIVGNTLNRLVHFFERHRMEWTHRVGLTIPRTYRV